MAEMVSRDGEGDPMSSTGPAPRSRALAACFLDQMVAHVTGEFRRWNPHLVLDRSQFSKFRRYMGAVLLPGQLHMNPRRMAGSSLRRSWETGLSWVPKGARGKLQGFEEPITTDVRLDYLQVPALVRLTVPSGACVRPSVIAGPALSLEARCEERLEIGAIANHIDCDDTDRVRTDWGILLGGGLAAGTGRMVVALEGRYELGLRDLDRVDAIETKSRGMTVTARVSRALR